MIKKRSTSAADRAGTSEGSGQFSSKQVEEDRAI